MANNKKRCDAIKRHTISSSPRSIYRDNARPPSRQPRRCEDSPSCCAMQSDCSRLLYLRDPPSDLIRRAREAKPHRPQPPPPYMKKLPLFTEEILTHETCTPAFTSCIVPAKPTNYVFRQRSPLRSLACSGRRTGYARARRHVSHCCNNSGVFSHSNEGR